MEEKNKRSIAKAVTYRIISIILDSAIAYLITKNTTQTIMLVVFSNLVSIVMYFFHERTWNLVKWGRSNRFMKCEE